MIAFILEGEECKIIIYANNSFQCSIDATCSIISKCGLALHSPLFPCTMLTKLQLNMQREQKHLLNFFVLELLKHRTLIPMRFTYNTTANVYSLGRLVQGLISLKIGS